MINKISKQSVLYLHKDRTQYQCMNCNMFLKDKERCTIHGKNDVIKSIGSCGFWVHGMAMKGTPGSEVTKLESGYVENAAGFSCKRCKFFIAVDRACSVVNRNSIGDDSGIIHPDACCNNWEKR